MRINKIAVLFSRLSGYMSSCLKYLNETYDVEIMVFHTPKTINAPFDDKQFAWIKHRYIKSDYSYTEMLKKIEQFSPDGVLMAGWFDSGYLKVARRLRGQGIPVIAGSDAQWNGSVRQRIGQAISRYYLHSAIDVLWVAGERQYQLARRLGYYADRCWYGYYSCNWNSFADVYSADGKKTNSAFLYVGRYIEKKGLNVLVDAYKKYRDLSDSPRNLICAGAGELDYTLSNIDGIIDNGFVQPENLPTLMSDASVFIIPSYWEPWGVVIQEAAATGLPIICSDKCGAAVHLVQDGYNGFVFRTGDSNHLARSMLRFDVRPNSAFNIMRQNSHELSKQFTQERWAKTLVNGLDNLLNQ